MEETRVCDICGREHPLSELKEFGGVLLCESCWNSETIVCSQCGKRIWLDDNESDGDTPLCQTCYDRYYTSAYRLIKEGHFKTVRIGNAIRVSRKSFDEWLDAQTF